MQIHIEQIMSTNVIAVGADESVNRAAELMWNHDVGYLPVVDTDGHVIAAITDRDICMAAFTQGRPLQQIPVRSAMSQTLVYVRPDAPLDVAEELMRLRRWAREPRHASRAHAHDSQVARPRVPRMGAATPARYRPCPPQQRYARMAETTR